jgi:hypothetical protein
LQKNQIIKDAPNGEWSDFSGHRMSLLASLLGCGSPLALSSLAADASREESDVEAELRRSFQSTNSGSWLFSAV